MEVEPKGKGKVNGKKAGTKHKEPFSDKDEKKDKVIEFPFLNSSQN
jgi:hypothetical protein